MPAIDNEAKSSRDWMLWYRQPAARWEEALPVGNGRIGGMVFGGIREESIALNEDTLWSGFPRDTQNYNAQRYLKRVRELIFAGKYAEAEKLINANMLGRNTESYQPLGHLRVVEQSEETVADYARQLDLNSGIAAVRYTRGGARVKREVFVSAADQVLAVRYESEGAALSELSIAVDSPLRHEISPAEEAANLLMLGSAPSHIAENYHGDHPDPIQYEEGLGLTFGARISVSCEGGSVRKEAGKIIVSGAAAVTILLAAATDFEGFQAMPAGGRPFVMEKLRLALEAAAAFSYRELRERHVAEHHRLFGRVDLHLGMNGNASLPTDERLIAYQAGQSDPQLEALYFQYGRYLLMASSRPGTQPAHLQGIWNPHMMPPWNSNYTTNINTEMNYWHAEVSNLSECHEPLFDMIRDMSVAGARTARIHYGCRGWAAHHNVDLWRMTTPSAGEASWAFWPMAGAWLCQHLWEHYAFSLDVSFLKQTAYPLMKGAAEFCLDYLVESPSGELVTAPSTSPENKFLTPEGERCSVSAGTAMDMAIIRELFSHCMQAASILGIDEEFARLLRETMSRMANPGIGPDGRLREWSQDLAEAEPGHRHVSHLYGLYPGHEITPQETPELAEAARKSLEARIKQGGGHTGWSCAWLINLYARLGDGESAYRFVQTLLSRSTYPNLFDDHPPFQIDGNFGGASGIAEMLLQSHRDGIDLLPALPNAWNSGNVSGLRARGGYTVSLSWQDGRLTEARVTATQSGPCRVRYEQALLVARADGEQMPDGGSFHAEPGVTYVIRPA
ncbi:glycoside hydrolase family 95 protein [Paenibacillus nanensis]|uniref:Glycoside hydrolase family 95 protein n=1 Tax=Paenibacillus nanensis TaxID=393251 RepID=A0A3A1V266_9BACL|nr:glycoside hydrolase family 95 protein [Paenibacillus nanensis]RIX52643.1 glycoside hydrolase family 95 protein [Paenibacillus nanensis]